MNKIASPLDLQRELRSLLTQVETATPSRVKLATEIRALADQVAGNRMAGRKPKTYQIPGGPKVRVYDNGGKTLDRYTVVMDGKDWDDGASPGMKAMLGLNTAGRGFSQFTDGQEGSHLGKGVDFESLDDATKRHIIQRLQHED